MLAELLKQAEEGLASAYLPLADELQDDGLIDEKYHAELSELAYQIMDEEDQLVVMAAVACYLELLKKIKR